jgi:hypothetical protein
LRLPNGAAFLPPKLLVDMDPPTSIR